MLDVGAGAGATTRNLLPLLPASRTHYTYTGVSAVFFGAARERFREYDFLRFRTLDLNDDPVDQGFDLAAYDIVIADCVLHATHDLATTMSRVADLLISPSRLPRARSGAHPARREKAFALLTCTFRLRVWPLRFAWKRSTPATSMPR
ncbi:class I SAM-dependent methyltransferase [Streptomyces klenkii]